VQCTQPPSLWPVQGCPRAFSSGNWGMNTLPQRCYMPSSTPNTQRRPSTLSKWVSTSVSTAPGNTSGNTLYFPPGGTKCLLAGKPCPTTRRGWDSNPRVLSDAGFQDRLRSLALFRLLTSGYAKLLVAQRFFGTSLNRLVSRSTAQYGWVTAQERHNHARSSRLSPTRLESAGTARRWIGISTALWGEESRCELLCDGRWRER
jgi:hypothetical protein